MFSLNYKYLTLCLVALGIYLLWMDVGLYLELQKFPARTPGNLQALISNRTTPSPYVFSPFCPMTVKLLMLPATIQYVDEPLAYLTVHHTRIAEYMSPNQMSYLGVIVALVSAKFLAHSDIRYRHLGVLLFKVRDYIDGLDGSIARERSHSHRMGHIANPESSGWMVDGICDGMGDFFRFVAFIVTLHRVLNSGGKVTQNVGTSYTLLDIDTVNMCPVSIGKDNGTIRIWVEKFYRWWLTYRSAIIVMTCVGLQSLFSSVIWNYFMINYHRVLETDQYWGDINYKGVVDTQAGILRSSSLWIVCYFWRLVNPLMITQIQLLAVLYGREVELLLAVPLIGYLPAAVVGLGSYLHLQLAEDAVRTAAYAL